MANIQITNLSQLESKLMPIVEDIMRQLANEVKAMVKDYIYENLYQAYYPQEYQRTGQFLECLDIRMNRKGNVVEAEIFFNTEFLDMNEVEGNTWNQHMSIDGSESWYGASVAEWIPYFIEWGTHNSLWDRDGLHSMQTIQKYLETTKYHLGKIISLLRTRGIVAKIS
jgi:hypothetical protein